MAKKNHLVTKSNVLNEMRDFDLNLTELRLFTVYLSKINPLDVNSVRVSFPINEFNNIFGIQQQTLGYYADIAGSLSKKGTSIFSDGLLKFFSIFEEVSVGFVGNESIQTATNFNIKIHKNLVEQCFNLKSKYIKYQLWNALSLKSVNQIRMYEILKQHEKKGYTIISLGELKDKLGIVFNTYSEYKDFNEKVLKVCQKALAKNTDIVYEYEVYSKIGRKIDKLKFSIRKNNDYNPQVRIEEFIEPYNASVEEEVCFAKEICTNNVVLENTFQELVEEEIEPEDRYDNEIIAELAECCNYNFDNEQMQSLLTYMVDIQKGFRGTGRMDFMLHCYRQLQLKVKSGKVKEKFPHFKYFEKIVSSQSQTWDNLNSKPQHTTLEKNQNQLAEKENYIDNLSFEIIKNGVAE